MENYFNKKGPRGPRKPKRIYEAIKEEDFLKLLSSAKSQRDKVILLLAYGSGLRLSDILNLKKEDIDVDRREIFIRQGKGSKDRITILPKQFKRKYLDELPFNLTPMGVQVMFQKLLKENNLMIPIGEFKTTDGKKRVLYKYRFHSLRHSFGTNLIAKKIPVNIVQSLMGHSNLATTSRYTQLNSKDAIDAILNKGL
jgi:integrase/recombinase XerD